ncbi:hypothetical protein DAMA08_022420 [Martiniozyma asiatica (nom. inval.)]|nr:hypothetical protein DAMA08_022420 [Martiniozyma asiatica]
MKLNQFALTATVLALANSAPVKLEEDIHVSDPHFNEWVKSFTNILAPIVSAPLKSFKVNFGGESELEEHESDGGFETDHDAEDEGVFDFGDIDVDSVNGEDLALPPPPPPPPHGKGEDKHHPPPGKGEGKHHPPPPPHGKGEGKHHPPPGKGEGKHHPPPPPHGKGEGKHHPPPGKAEGKHHPPPGKGEGKHHPPPGKGEGKHHPPPPPPGNGNGMRNHSAPCHGGEGMGKPHKDSAKLRYRKKGKFGKKHGKAAPEDTDEAYMISDQIKNALI